MSSKGSILVTGANGGLGSAIAAHLVSSPELAAHHGIYTVRNAQNAPALDAALRQSRPKPTAPPHTSEKVSLDLSRLSSVREVAADISSRVASGRIPPIRAIILNAGVEEFATQTWTEDGLDLTFATNYLGHWLLSLMLLGSMDRERGRILWVSSWSHNPRDSHNAINGAYQEDKFKAFISDDLDPIANGSWSATKDDPTNWAAGYRRYGVSKLCGIMMIHELQRRLDQDPMLSNISVLAIDPGAMPTDIMRNSGFWMIRCVVFPVVLPVITVFWGWLWPNGAFRTVEKSARDVVAAVIGCGPPPLSEHPKGLYLNGSEQGEYNNEALDPVKRGVVWRGSVRFAKLDGGETLLKDWQ
ncbi:putative short-chain dehydrogenase [Diaporthe sp. PMI_573]|nr:putative short-chain dehydrogenase [Diaporthaceae sp. PMI_573]